MTMPNPQPELPIEGEYSDVERLFISEQPPGLFPENQNSNFGFLRKVISDELQLAVNQMTALFNEMFIETAGDATPTIFTRTTLPVDDSGFLGLWEEEMGLPVASSGLAVLNRRTRLASRRTIGLFTRTRRKNIVERFITDTFGASPSFGSGGISLVGGIELHSEAGSVTSFYNIIEDISDFSYEVQISNSVDPDLVGLERELDWLTPAHISFTITRF